MAIDKGLYQAPLGIADEAALMEGPELEIEVVDPEAVRVGIDGETILEIEEGEETAEDFYDNLAEKMDLSELQSMGNELIEDVKSDMASRKDWEDTYKEGITLMGLKYEERTEPWNGACGVFHPMITEAVVRFQSETIMETFPAQGPVKTKIIGKETREKEEAAQRVKEDMNFELTERMPEFRTEHERMLWNLPAAGSAFKKVYYDPGMQRQMSIFVPAEDVIISYGAASIDTAERVTHRMYKTKNEIRKLQVAGFYRDVELGDPPKVKNELQEKKDKETGFNSLNDDRYVLYEIQINLDLLGYEDKEDGKETGIALPYIVTIMEGSNEVLAIRRNYYEDDVTKEKRSHFVHYIYIPGFGVYGFGLFHLIGGFARSATSIMRQLVDAGTLSNLPGGLKARGLRIKGDDTPIAPGEFRDVDVASGAIRDNILPLPYKEPSATLYNLMNTIVEEGRRFAATADMKISDMSAQAPVGTTLALLERMLKVMSAVQARVHYAFKQELKLLAGIIRDYTDEQYEYDPVEGNRRAKKSDYDMVDVIPVSDPNAATMSQRVVQYQAVIQLAQAAPQIYDLPALHRQMLEVLGIKNAAKLVPIEDDQKPRDPVSENMDALNGKPLKAFMYQDHDAHMQVHMAFMQDPMMAQVVGQNPMAQQIQAAMQAHIAQHLGFKYRQQIEEQLGMPLPMGEDRDEEIPEELEVQISRLVAEASKRVLIDSQQKAQAIQAMQQMQDPVVQMQQQEIQIRAKEADAKVQKVLLDAEAKNKELALREQELMQRAAQADEELRLKAETEGLKIGAGIAKDRATINRPKGDKTK